MIYDPTKSWPNHKDADSHRTNIITAPQLSAKYGRSFEGDIFTVQITDMADLYTIKITDD